MRKIDDCRSWTLICAVTEPIKLDNGSIDQWHRKMVEVFCDHQRGSRYERQDSISCGLFRALNNRVELMKREAMADDHFCFAMNYWHAMSKCCFL